MAKNFSNSQFGLADDSTATGTFSGSATWDYSSDKVDIKNHVASTVGFAQSDDKTTVKMEGAVVTKTVGMVPSLASVIVLANSSMNGLALNSDGLFSSPVANAGLVITSMSLKRVNNDFETGDIEAVYHPLVATNAPVTVT